MQLFTVDNLIEIPGKSSRLEHKTNRIHQQERFRKENEIRFKTLTPREKEILSLLLRGSNNKEVGESLFISRHTVEQHRKNINRKLGTSSLHDLYRYGLAFDLL